MLTSGLEKETHIRSFISGASKCVLKYANMIAVFETWTTVQKYFCSWVTSCFQFTFGFLLFYEMRAYFAFLHLFKISHTPFHSRNDKILCKWPFQNEFLQNFENFFLIWFATKHRLGAFTTILYVQHIVTAANSQTLSWSTA